VVEFIRAFNERDLEAFVEVLHPEVELHSMKGLRKGHEEAREWATRPAGGVQQTILVDEIRTASRPPGVTVVALISRRWHWEEDGSFAEEDRMAWSFQLDDGLVRSWRPFADGAEGLRQAGIPNYV
jgi:hypothetical protein